MDKPPERDWKEFRSLREVALERLCSRIISELETTCRADSESYHQRFLRAWEIINRRNKQVAEAFDGPRRSQMIWQLASMKRLDLVKDEELEGFTERTRDTLEVLAPSQSTRRVGADWRLELEGRWSARKTMTRALVPRLVLAGGEATNRSCRSQTRSFFGVQWVRVTELTALGPA